MRSRLRVLWALDPFEQAAGDRPCLRAAQLLRAWASRMSLEIEPVFVLESYRLAAEQTLKEVLRTSGLQTTEPVIIVEEFASIRQSVESISHRAISTGADVIVAHTHGRAGLKRLFMGSFTETLLSVSKIPVVVVSPESDVSGETGAILFPTDFDPSSRETLRSVVSLSKLMNSSLLIFHCIPRPLEPVFQSGVYLLGGTWIPVQSYFMAERRRVERRARIWTQWALSQGVRASLHIEREAENVGHAIRDKAVAEKANLIAMQCKRGTWSAAIAGSVTREIIRHAPCPVWVNRTGARSEAVNPLSGRAA